MDRLSARETEAGPLELGARTANERFRVRWRRQLGGSIIVAVALHAAAFVGAGRLVLSLPVPQLDASIGDGGLQVLSFASQEGSSPVAVSVARPVGGIVETSSDDATPASTLGAGGSSMDDDALRAALGDRLRRRGGTRLAPVPEPIGSPEPAPTPSHDDVPAGAEGEDEPDIGANATMAAELSDLPEPDSLTFDRLSDIEPQLALMSASAWVLIRNQQEVEAYLRRGYSDGELDASEVGSVSVTLWIDRKGSVEWAEISKTSGHPKLDEYALALFNEVADFRAAREQGVSVSRSVTFSLNFPW